MGNMSEGIFHSRAQASIMEQLPYNRPAPISAYAQAENAAQGRIIAQPFTEQTMQNNGNLSTILNRGIRPNDTITILNAATSTQEANIQNLNEQLKTYSKGKYNQTVPKFANGSNFERYNPMDTPQNNLKEFNNLRDDLAIRTLGYDKGHGFSSFKELTPEQVIKSDLGQRLINTPGSILESISKTDMPDKNLIMSNLIKSHAMQAGDNTIGTRFTDNLTKYSPTEFMTPEKATI